MATILAPLILRPKKETQLTVHDIHPTRLCKVLIFDRLLNIKDLLLHSTNIFTEEITSSVSADILSNSSLEDDDQASTRGIFPNRSPTPSSASIYTTRTTKTGASLGIQGYSSADEDNHSFKDNQSILSETQSVENRGGKTVLFIIEDNVKNKK